MAIDITKLRKTIQNSSQNKNYYFWKPPKDGEYNVRVFPGKEEDGSDLFFEGGFHRLGSNDFLNCPTFNDKPCPICDMSKRLYASGTEEDKKLAGTLRARKQYYYNGMLRDEMFKKDSEGKQTDEIDIKLLQFGIKIHNKIINGILDEDIGDITDFKNGYDLKVVRKQVSGQNNYDDTEIARKPSPAFKDEKHEEYVKSHLLDAKQYQRYLTYDALKSCLEEYLENGSIVTSSLKEKYEGGSSSSSSESKAKAPRAESKEVVSESFPKDEDFPKDEPSKTKEVKQEVKDTSGDTETEDDFENWDKEFENDIDG